MAKKSAVKQKETGLGVLIFMCANGGAFIGAASVDVHVQGGIADLLSSMVFGAIGGLVLAGAIATYVNTRLSEN